MEPINPNRATLPDALQYSIKKFHIARVGSGTLVFILGAASIGYYSTFGYAAVMTAGIAAALSGACGMMATQYRSLAMHAACLATSAISVYLGLSAYSLCLQKAARYSSDEEKGALVLCDLLVVVVDLVVGALVLGLQAAVLYVATKLQQ